LTAFRLVMREYTAICRTGQAVWILARGDSIADDSPQDRFATSDGTSDAMAESTPPAIFTSVLLSRIEALRQAKAPAAHWIGTITNLAQKGVKTEEIAWCGVLDWLKARGSRVITRDELAAYVRAATPGVTEWTKGGDGWQDRVEIRRDQGGGRVVFRDGALWACGFASDAASKRWLAWATAPDYSHPKYRLPGGTNYRELLLLWPQARRVFDPARVAIKRHEDDGSYPPKTSIWYGGICIGRCDDPPLADYDGEIKRAPDDHWRKVVAGTVRAWRGLRRRAASAALGGVPVAAFFPN
jgi:hypothetical protein